MESDTSNGPPAAAKAQKQKIESWLEKTMPEIQRLVILGKQAEARGARLEMLNLQSRMLNMKTEIDRRQKKLAKLRRRWPDL